MAPAVTWGGYGSLSAYRGGIDGAAMRPDPQIARAASGGDWRLDGESRLALQGRVSLAASAEAVLQLSTSSSQDGNLRPRVDWAYVGWNVGGSLNLRLGRQTLPVLRYSESRHAAYAQAAVRPNPAVYVLNPGSPVDGANLSWEHDAASGNWRLDLGAGRSSATTGGTKIDVKRSLVAALQWQGGAMTARLAASSYAVELGQPGFLGTALQSQCSNCDTVLAQRAAYRDLSGRLVSAMLVWDGHPWELSAEALWRTGSSVLIPGARGAYVQLSRRLGAWQLQGGVGRVYFREPPLGLQAVAGAPPAAVAGLAALDRFLQAPNDLATLQFGFRWDLASGVALKLQQDHWRALRDSSTGRRGLILLDSPPLSPNASTWNGRARMTTLALDFVY